MIIDSEKLKKYIREIDDIAAKTLDKNSNCAINMLRLSAQIQYDWNQRYVDELAESCLLKLSQKFKFDYNDVDDNTVLFYDAFGFDTRGLALIYVKALYKLGYRVVYVVPQDAFGNQPEFEKNVSKKNVKFCYLKNKRGEKKIGELKKIFFQYKPGKAFFYTKPDDVEGCIVFTSLKNKVKRYQVNLTDHAFWLGKNTFDLCVEFRNRGACVSYKYRGIEKDKCVLLPYYPYINDDMEFTGFPFVKKNNSCILFSGGSIYKTFSKNGEYYSLVRRLLEENDNLIFLYAGSGDTSRLEQLQNVFPERVYYIEERKDLWQLMKNVDIYLNTYPFLGGLMTQYAAAAGVPPLTLADTEDSNLDGLLLNHGQLNCEFLNMDDICREVSLLQKDNNYRFAKGKACADAVMNEQKFMTGLDALLRRGNTDFHVEWQDVDTRDFRAVYDEQYSEYKFIKTIKKWRYYKFWSKHLCLLKKYAKYKINKQ